MVRNTRRTFIRGIASAGALAGMTGVASASRRTSETSGALDVKDGQLEMSVQDDSGTVSSQSDLDGVDEDRLQNIANNVLNGDGPTEIEGEDAAAFMAKGVEKLNEAADAGEIEFGRQNGEVVVTPTAQTVNEVSGSPTQSDRRTAGSTTETSDSDRQVSTEVHNSDCGDTEWTVDTPSWSDPYVRHDISMSDDDTKAVKTALEYTAAASALAGVFSTSSVAGVPLSVVAGIIVFATGTLAITLGYYNDGCGVDIDVDHLPLPAPSPTISNLTFNVDISTQHS